MKLNNAAFSTPLVNSTLIFHQCMKVQEDSYRKTDSPMRLRKKTSQYNAYNYRTLP
jgi:hypothetical protein